MWTKFKCIKIIFSFALFWKLAVSYVNLCCLGRKILFPLFSAIFCLRNILFPLYFSITAQSLVRKLPQLPHSLQLPHLNYRTSITAKSLNYRTAYIAPHCMLFMKWTIGIGYIKYTMRNWLG